MRNLVENSVGRLVAGRMDTRGTALLIALLVMGVLISVSLALSALIFREIRVTADFVDAGRAYYAAESAIEQTLYDIENKLPGWDTDGEYKAMQISGDLGSVAEYMVFNTCNAYPCFDEGFDRKGLPVKEYYDVLDLNEVITIPLFVVDDENNVHPVEDFTVEFFAPFNPSEDLVFSESSQKFDLSGWDILRWKIFGLHETTKATETISDFTAISTIRQADLASDIAGFDASEINEGDFDSLGNLAISPSWFGTKDCDEMRDADRSNPDIKCLSYVIRDAVQIGQLKPGQEAKTVVGLCDNTEAREYYAYHGDNELKSEDIGYCYPISNFLGEHELNYLTLTNMMNPSMLRKDYSVDKKEALSKLYFRVELYGRETVREYVSVKANGYSGDVKQSIEMKLRRGSFMPVFNFSLYSTYKGDQGWEHYYGDE